MSLFQIFDVAGSGMTAQSVRLNTTASNIANADTVSGSAESAYRSRQPYFLSVLKAAGAPEGYAGVRVAGVIESQAPAPRLYQPGHAEADDNGYVYGSNVNAIEELVNMISASRAYQNNVEVMNTSKQLLMRTLSLGQ
ncbi:MAG: flagellar basal body rod protein FlgC [Pseudomonadota bacterium]|nr:flagellar basal body rod protein FlgC [Pseudomonadota bacterium]